MGQETRRGSLDGFRGSGEEASAFGPMMRVACSEAARSLGLTAVCSAKRQHSNLKVSAQGEVVGTTGKELTMLKARMCRYEEGLDGTWARVCGLWVALMRKVVMLWGESRAGYLCRDFGCEGTLEGARLPRTWDNSFIVVTLNGKNTIIDTRIGSARTRERAVLDRSAPN